MFCTLFLFGCGAARDGASAAQRPRPVEDPVDRAVRQADVNAVDNQNRIDSQNKMATEMERTTGKPAKNPAETIPATVQPPRLTDPLSAPAGDVSR
jgi:hypothetical protein